MPEMNGLETVAAIRALGGRFETLPIMALTANIEAGMLEMFLENGFNDFVSKPIEMPKLEKTLKKWIPVERRRKHARAAAVDILPDAPESPFAGIDGLDVVKGMVIAGGKSAAYRDVLRLYCRDANERIEFFRLPCAETQLNTFISHAHALKSASAAVGASGLSVEAGSLEAAGNRADMEFIRDHVDGFRSRLARMLERIGAVLAVDKERAPDAEDGKADIKSLHVGLAPKLRRLKKALKIEDVQTTDRLLAELSAMQLDAESDAALSRVSDMILISEFGEAVIILDNILRNPS
jgi:CheY-like chemotaxis protein